MSRSTITQIVSANPATAKTSPNQAAARNGSEEKPKYPESAKFINYFRSHGNSAEVSADCCTFYARKTSNNVVGTKSSVLANRKIRYVPISGLTLRANNPRTHSRRQIKQIARSIERFGFVNPILVDGNGKVICGHGRVAGARLLGIESVPTIALEHLSEAELRAYVITDNRLAEKAGWDNEILSIELTSLSE